MNTLKAISLHQPWAWALFHGKDIENRSWKTNYRGDLLIHASKIFDYKGYSWIVKNKHLIDDSRIVKLTNNFRDFNINNFNFCCIIGRVTVVDCVVSSPSPWFFGPYGFVLENPIEFTNPIPFRGQQRFFNVPAELIKE
jgi:hypothetical protein